MWIKGLKQFDFLWKWLLLFRPAQFDQNCDLEGENIKKINLKSQKTAKMINRSEKWSQML